MTPKTIDRDVKRLISRLNASHEELWLDVEAEPGAQLSDCFPIVQNKVRKDGGRFIMGWQIWKTKHIVEAECHAVWEDQDEELHDLTPKESGDKVILFVEDEKLIYEEKQIDNIRINISNNTLVDDLITVCEALFRFYNKGERAVLHELTDVLNNEQREHMAYLETLKSMINFLLTNNGNRKSPCPCRSSLKFQDCHRLNFERKTKMNI